MGAHDDQVRRLRNDALIHRHIAAELEKHARLIECHVACLENPTCVPQVTPRRPACIALAESLERRGR